MTRSTFSINRHNSSMFCLLVISILLILCSSNETSSQTIEKITPQSFTVKNSSTVVSPEVYFKVTKTFQTDSESHYTQPILYNQSEESSIVVPFAISNSTITITSDILKGEGDLIKINNTTLGPSN